MKIEVGQVWHWGPRGAGHTEVHTVARVSGGWVHLEETWADGSPKAPYTHALETCLGWINGGLWVLVKPSQQQLEEAWS